MKLEDYEKLPDSMPVAEVLEHCKKLLDSDEAQSEVLSKLDILADRQWHTYQLPNPMLQAKLRAWLMKHWVSEDQDYLEAVLGLAYCFGLDKEIYELALVEYHGDHVAEFRKNLEMSAGDNIEPWWSMTERNA